MLFVFTCIAFISVWITLNVATGPGAKPDMAVIFEKRLISSDLTSSAPTSPPSPPLANAVHIGKRMESRERTQVRTKATRGATEDKTSEVLRYLVDEILFPQELLCYCTVLFFLRYTETAFDYRQG